MNDLEMTKLCAEAMGIEIRWNDYLKINQYQRSPGDVMHYAPLQDDAQAMGLVKKFRLHILACEDGEWWVSQNALLSSPKGANNDLNRAIVECVAKMQQAK